MEEIMEERGEFLGVCERLWREGMFGLWALGEVGAGCVTAAVTGGLHWLWSPALLPFTHPSSSRSSQDSRASPHGRVCVGGQGGQVTHLVWCSLGFADQELL